MDDIPMADPPAQSMVDRPYLDADQCAIQAIDEINPDSIKRNVEFAGRIYRKGRDFFSRDLSPKTRGTLRCPSEGTRSHERGHISYPFR
jgi:hypothetical protein